MNEIEYAFGTGDGTVDVWSTQADLELTGSPDAVQLDFDGDGLTDDAMWDTKGDGVADVAALDLNDDGVLDAFFTDPSGTGVWDHQITGSAADAASEPLDWVVRGEAPPAPDITTATGGFDAPTDPLAGHASSPPATPADPATWHAAPPHPAPPADPFAGPRVPAPAEQPGEYPVPPPMDPFGGHPTPAADPFARPDVQPGTPAGLLVQVNLEMRVNASLGLHGPPDPIGSAADGQA
ncbi:hypothetical protein GV794_00585 [Nocardia cyriacigeorgica]|uniref:Uncharacterized protein n=1 Tax=Nocardia cyriacigeorgica TaxID=135487 RepID=A0A6P1D0N3_9NOCA|nr:hypothetical protein [Nocardia cyriacigeorgica]NEW38398.1 hypothetical protein [Nocardia cyriacigeorgica]NEW43638.1 hypothetical protein [Nocardia cyriacigeorgica]NEW49426.1 hypothetical protein [Nocardia cyriacigeorgica]NEW54170.1 hypothetical protein [Nocardia cyriacigeorgica]